MFATQAIAEGQVAVELNQWTHLAGIYDSKKLCSYTNGELDVEIKQPNSIFASDIPMAIGGYSQKTEMRIWQKSAFHRCD